MPFEKGHKKLGGVKKGQISPKTLLLKEIFEYHRYDPVRSLLQLLPELEVRDQSRVHLELMQYIFPKIKEPPPDETLDITPEALASEALEHIKENFPQLLKAKDE
jgi:hypothetical protein